MRGHHKETSYQYEALKIAEQLGYSDETIIKIKRANSDNEISRIMMQARKEKFK